MSQTAPVALLFQSLVVFTVLIHVASKATVPRARDLIHTEHSKCYQNHLDPNDPTSLAYYRALSDHFDEHNAPHPGLGYLERVPAGKPSSLSPVNGEDKDIHLMRISALFSFLSKKYDEETGEPYLTTRGREKNRYGIAAASLLAAHHFNTGDGSVIAEVQDIHKKCPVRIALDFHDIESNRRSAVDLLTNQIFMGERTPTTAIFGGLYSSTSIPTATLAGVYGVPQACPSCTSTELDSTKQYPLFGRIIPSDAGTARAIVSFAAQRNRESNEEELRFMGVLYKNDAFGTAYYLALKESEYYWIYSEGVGPTSNQGSYDEDAADHLHVQGAHFSSDEDIDAAVQTMAKTGYRVFVGIFYTADYEKVMEAAYRYGIAGPGYVWILTDGFGPDYFNDKSFPTDSPIAIASQGIGVIMAHGGRLTEAGDTGYDRIVDSWTKQTADTVDYMNCVGHPKMNSLNTSIYYQAESNFFQDKDLIPPKLVFFYDSIITFGLAACDVLAEAGEDATSDHIYGGDKLIDAFLKQDFMGSSGLISMDPETHSRRPGTAFFVVYNAQGTTDGNVTTFTRDIVSHTNPASNSNSTDIVWVDVPGKSYIYSDNTTKFPYPLPEIEDFNMNYINTSVRVAFLFFAAVIIGLSALFSAWTFYNRKKRVIKCSQPTFLWMICAGTTLMGASVVTLSIDDSIASVHGCTVACMLSPWFFAIGFVFAFSSLFAKEWRINKLLNNPWFTRLKVEPKDVLAPFAVLMVLNVLVLSLWTGLSPLVWERTYVGIIDKYGRQLQSVGMCSAETKHWAPYTSVLLIINMTMVVLASIQAYRARRLSVEYSESKWVAIIYAVILQAVAIGIPLMVIASHDPTISFVVKAGLVVILSITFLLVMFVPKFFYLRDANIEAAKKQEEQREARMRRTAFQQRVSAERSGGSGASSQNTSAGASGARVLFHPKTHDDELGALLDELNKTKEELRLQTERITQENRDTTVRFAPAISGLAITSTDWSSAASETSSVRYGKFVNYLNGPGSTTD